MDTADQQLDALKEMLGLLSSVRMVTLLEVWRRATGRQRPSMAAAIEATIGDKAKGLCADILRDLERRRSDLDPALVPVMCEFFKVSSLALLGVGTDPEADRYRAWMNKDEFVTEMLNRRRLLVMGMAGAAGKLLPVSPLVAAAHSLAEVGREDRRIEQAHVTTARNTATELAAAYAAAPTAEAVRAAKAHAYTLFSLLKPNAATMSGTVRRDLQAVASDAAALSGYGEYDAGRLAEADRWFRCALELAREARDRRLEALALASFGQTPTRNADLESIAAALHTAAELQDFLPPAASAWLFGYLARVHADLADDLVSGRFLEEARAAVTRIPRYAAGWGWWSTHGELAGFDGVRPEHFAGRRLLRLGRPAEAIEVFDDSLGGVTQPVRRAAWLWNVMEACVALGDPDRACASGTAVLDLAREHGSLRVNVGDVRDTRSIFPTSWSGLMVVRDLDDYLRAVA